MASERFREWPASMPHGSSICSANSSARSRPAIYDAEAQIDLRNAVLITVIADVARNYFEIRGLQIRLEIARKDVAEAKRMIDLVATRLEHGESSKSDLAPATDESKATSTKPGVRVSERRNKSSESKELDFPLAEGELAIQLARL